VELDTLKVLKDVLNFTEGDIFEDDYSIIIAEVPPCECLRLQKNMGLKMASVCYEIGNINFAIIF
jgi:urease accessory protein UreE